MIFFQVMISWNKDLLNVLDHHFFKPSQCPLVISKSWKTRGTSTCGDFCSETQNAFLLLPSFRYFKIENLNVTETSTLTYCKVRNFYDWPANDFEKRFGLFQSIYKLKNFIVSTQNDFLLLSNFRWFKVEFSNVTEIFGLILCRKYLRLAYKLF